MKAYSSESACPPCEVRWVCGLLGKPSNLEPIGHREMLLKILEEQNIGFYFTTTE
jgi:hypothetical protein